MDPREYEDLMARLEACEDECKTVKFVSITTIIALAFCLAATAIVVGVL